MKQLLLVLVISASGFHANAQCSETAMDSYESAMTVAVHNTYVSVHMTCRGLESGMLNVEGTNDLLLLELQTIDFALESLDPFLESGSADEVSQARKMNLYEYMISLNAIKKYVNAQLAYNENPTDENRRLLVEEQEKTGDRLSRHFSSSED